jgi:pseudouridine synthase
MLHKPRGPITTTHDPQGRDTVMDLVDIPLSKTGGRPIRLYPVGRLDADSEGLLLLTNDGRLTHRLTHPSFEHDRVYRVRVLGHPEEDVLDRWRTGIVLDGRRSKFDRVTVISRKGEYAWLRVTLHEGRNHIVRRIVAAMGHPADRLIRVQMGPLTLGDLPAGQWRYLREREIRALEEDVGIQPDHNRSSGSR